MAPNATPLWTAVFIAGCAGGSSEPTPVTDAAVEPALDAAAEPALDAALAPALDATSDAGPRPDVARPRDATTDARGTELDAAEPPSRHDADARPPEDVPGPAPDAALPRCGAFVDDCDHIVPAEVQEHHMQAVDGCAFGLVRDGTVEQAGLLADGVAGAADGYRSLAQVLGDLNRDGRRGITAGAADRLKNHDFVGVRWNSGDHDVDYWMPQGITGGSDAQADGRPEGRRLFLVSWYHKTDARPTKGARISLLDLTDVGEPSYRHLLLVDPVERDGAPTFGAAEYDGGGALHAGGIVWWGRWLYVADTRQGLRVYDLGRITRVPDTDDKDRVGVSAGRVDAHGYRYAVPLVDRYRPAPGACPVKFSFVALDRSSDPPSLVSGEYHSDHPRGLLVHWRLDPETGWLEEEEDGVVRGVDGRVSGQTRVQGALSYEGSTYLSSSSQVGRLGRLYRTRPGLESRITAWPYGCEDLYMERDTDLIWTATEHPGAREVVGIPLRRP